MAGYATGREAPSRGVAAGGSRAIEADGPVHTARSRAPQARRTTAPVCVVTPYGGRADFLLAALRCARLRASLLVIDLDVTGLALGRGIVGAEAAAVMLEQAGALDYVLACAEAAAERQVDEVVA